MGDFGSAASIVPLFKFDHLFFHVGHGIDDQFHKPSVIDVASLLGLIKLLNIPNGTLAVGTRGAHVFGNLQGFILKSIQNLEEFLPAAYQDPLILKIVSGHNRKPRTAPAAVIIHPMRGHLPESRGDLPQDAPLGLDDAHGPHHIARIVQGDRKIIARRVRFKLTRMKDSLQGYQSRFPRNVQVPG